MQSEILSNEVPAWDFDGMTAEDFLKEDWLEYLAAVFIVAGKTKTNIELEKFDQAGKALGFRRAIKFWEGYLDDTDMAMKSAGSDLTTDFAGQPLRLNSGRWTCTDEGITTFESRVGELIACRHPILPIERIVNVDSGFEQLRLAYQRHGTHRWNTSIVAPKSLLASPQKIIELADRGISVTADNAKLLISYLQEIEDMNYQEIPETRSTGRLGWINDTEFSPYAEDLNFDESSSFARQYKAVKQEGSYETWLELVRELRQKSVLFKIVIAASFASPLLHKLDVLPAFVHLWASQSSTGKTVAIMVGASVWGDPSAGAYVQSFNSTTNAMERMAEFYNSMPLVLDELQQAKDNRGRGGVNVYNLAQGSGKSRSNRQGGLEKVPTWANFILSTGESPLVEQSDGEGALARVINLELTQKLVDAEAGNRIVRTIKDNHGHAGKRFIEALLDPNTVYTDALLNEIYDANVRTLSESDSVQDKQVMSAAAIITGDMLASQLIFGDDPLTIDDIRPFLLGKKESSIGTRAMRHTRGWIAQNKYKFQDLRTRDGNREVYTELYGVIEADCTYIIDTTFNQMMQDAGFNPSSVLSNWKQSGLIRYEDSRNVYRKRINGERPYTVAILAEPDDLTDSFNSTLPFE